MKMRKLLILLAVILLVPLMALAEEVTVGENERFTLRYDPEMSQIALEDKLTGETWRSTPEDLGADTIASGTNKLNRQSDLIVQYYNTSYVTNSVNSYTGSIKDGNFTWKQIDQGVEITYTFAKQGFVIPVRYVLEKEGLTASILSEGIQEGVWEKETSADKLQTVMSVSLLPFMGAADGDDEGYLIVPDGSGALIRFNNGRTGSAIYQREVFGRDETLSVRRVTTSSYDLNMPLFGMVRNGRALLGVVDNGAYQAVLNAYVRGQATGFNNAYFSVSYLQMETNTLMPGSGHDTDVTLPTNNFRDMGDFTVHYWPLEAENATYADVAAAYRRKLGLQDNDHLQPAQVQLEMIASIPAIRTVMGIPYRGIHVLTDYADAARAIHDVSAGGGAEVNLRYLGWSDQSVRGKLVTGLALDGRLGGRRGFDELLEMARATGSEVTLAVDMLNLYEDGNGYWSLFAATDNINSTSRQMTEFLQSTGYTNPKSSVWYLLSPDQVPGEAQKLADGLKDKVSSLALQSLGNMIYSSYGKTGISRTASAVYWEEALKKLTAAFPGLSTRAGASYTFPYVSHMDQVPAVSSRYDITDEDIPFYQLVTHGSMTLYSEPVNETGNTEDMMLRLIEYGMQPSWRLIARDTLNMMGSDYASWFAVSYDAWYDEITRWCRTMAPLKAYMGQQMTAHEKLTASLTATTYENGDTVLVNYGDKDAVWEGTTVPARGYAIKEAGTR